MGDRETFLLERGSANIGMSADAPPEGGYVEQPSYGFGTVLHGIGFEEARAKVTEALADQGFGVLTEIDVKATLAKKIGVDFRPYLILGACNPHLAHRALSGEAHLGLLLPCNVVLQQTDAGVEVSIADPKMMFTMVDNPDVAPVAEEADQRLRRVLATLSR